MKLIPWILCGILALMAAFLKFCVPGYSFSALVCICIIAVILFYKVSGLLLPRFPKSLPAVRKIFTVCLCIGLLVVGITEGIIIYHSFGAPKESCSYVVVLGAKVNHNGPSVSLWDRIRGAYDYLEDHPDVTLIVSGGQGSDEPMSEAQSMYEELVAMGADPDQVWMEDKATSTWENINFSLDLIEARTGVRPRKLGILSSEYHLFRVKLLADKCGIESVGIPAHTSRLSQMINHFMREVAGVWHSILLGGQYD